MESVTDCVELTVFDWVTPEVVLDGDEESVSEIVFAASTMYSISCTKQKMLRKNSDTRFAGDLLPLSSLDNIFSPLGSSNYYFFF